ncbi:MAG: metallophosphoesterase [Vampirovibrionales bacterium]|nr:metallophosphoesterase [Vampirovibrionales bacterium]
MLTHNDLKLNEHVFYLPRLPQAWANTKVVQLSDLHFYEYSDLGYYQRVADTVNALEPDLIAVTGDVVHYGTKHVDKAQWFLSLLEARLGKYAIMGNHDYYDFAKGRILRETMSASGLNVLVNQAVALEKTPDTGQYSPQLSQRLWVAGVDDLWCGAPDLEKTLQEVPKNEFILMLGHNPLLFDPVSHYQNKPIDLLLSGHTHAGHVYLPPLALIYRHVFKMKYRYHHFEKSHPDSKGATTPHHTQLYVSSGVGSAAFYLKRPIQMGFPRFRYNTHPEIALHRLMPGLMPDS